MILTELSLRRKSIDRSSSIRQSSKKISFRVEDHTLAGFLKLVARVMKLSLQFSRKLLGAVFCPLRPPNEVILLVLRRRREDTIEVFALSRVLFALRTIRLVPNYEYCSLTQRSGQKKIAANKLKQSRVGHKSTFFLPTRVSLKHQTDFS